MDSELADLIRVAELDPELKKKCLHAILGIKDIKYIKI
jgi:hypothetical protein